MDIKLKRKAPVQKKKYSHLIVLPIFWVEASQIHKGDLIGFELRKDGALVLRKDNNNNEVDKNASNL